MIRFIISAIVSLLIAAAAYHFIFQKSGNGGGLYGQNPTQSIQGAKNAVQQDTNYTNQVKSTVQNQYGQ